MRVSLWQGGSTSGDTSLEVGPLELVPSPFSSSKTFLNSAMIILHNAIRTLCAFVRVRSGSLADVRMRICHQINGSSNYYYYYYYYYYLKFFIHGNLSTYLSQYR